MKKENKKLILCYETINKLSIALKFVNENISQKNLVSFRYYPASSGADYFYEVIFWKEVDA